MASFLFNTLMSASQPRVICKDRVLLWSCRLLTVMSISVFMLLSDVCVTEAKGDIGVTEGDIGVTEGDIGVA